MNIDGLGEKLIEKFISLNLISNKLDIYKLENHKDKIIKLMDLEKNLFKI